jgi:hypothetical protein
MSKAHRGKGLRQTPAFGRATCPVCKRERVKVLYEQLIEGSKTKICKVCKATIANAK